jgi:hypothetical protein
MREPEELESPEITEEELALLDHWRVPEPPAQFAEAVIERAKQEEEPKKKRSIFVPIAAAAALLAALSGLFVSSSSERSGEIHATERTTADLGGRAIVVLEPGTDLAWHVASDGTAEIDQERGDAFYRVEKGGSFVVRTSMGTVRVVGTCFRVEVDDDMRTMKAGLTGAAAGAAIASAVLVTVYEGRVVTASEGEERAVSAGEAAELSRGQAPRVFESRGAPKAATKGGDAARSAEAPVAGSSAAASAASANLPPLKERVESAQLRERVAELEAEVEKLSKKSRDRRTYDIPQAELEAMASRCELRWDMPSMGSNPPNMSSEDVAELGLSPEDRKVVDSIFADHHKEMRRELERIYSEATGDTNVGSLSSGAMIDEIQDKTPRNEVQAVFQRLAKERAGQAPASDPSAPQLPIERLMRLLTSSGDRVEGRMAEKLGPNVAHAVRDLHGGYGDRSSSSHGCPK